MPRLRKASTRLDFQLSFVPGNPCHLSITEFKMIHFDPPQEIYESTDEDEISKDDDYVYEDEK